MTFVGTDTGSSPIKAPATKASPPDTVMSYGILLYRARDDSVLMIQRRDSVEYIDLLRGRFRGDRYLLETYIHRITEEEHRRLCTLPFDKLWDDLWGSHNARGYTVEFHVAKFKFDRLLPDIELHQPGYTEKEYLLPRGRKNDAAATGPACAIREFQEETGIRPSEYTLTGHFIDEQYQGSNQVSYGTRYYVALFKGDEYHHIHSKTEVSSCRFVPLTESFDLLRDYRASTHGVLCRFLAERDKLTQIQAT